MNNKSQPIGYATTIKTLLAIPRDMYNSVMTIENSPLKNLDPMAAHVVFQSLAFVWSGVFAAMLGSMMAFGISAVFHILLISGVVITAMTFREANNNAESINRLVKTGIKYNGRAADGEHV
jgi:uncharacterized membrane protein